MRAQPCHQALPEPLMPGLLCLYSKHPPAQATHLLSSLKKPLTPLLQAVSGLGAGGGRGLKFQCERLRWARGPWPMSKPFPLSPASP